MLQSASSRHHRRKRTAHVSQHETDPLGTSLGSSGGSRHENHRQRKAGRSNRHSLIRTCRGHVITLILGVLLGYILLPFLVPDDAALGISSIGGSTGQTVHDKKSFIRENNYFQDDSASHSLPWQKNPAILWSPAEQRLVDYQNVMARQSIPTRTTPYIMKTQILPDHHRKKIVVSGGAGFVGSHLVDKLMMEGHEVIVLDNFFTGQKVSHKVITNGELLVRISR